MKGGGPAFTRIVKDFEQLVLVSRECLCDKGEGGEVDSQAIIEVKDQAFEIPPHGFNYHGTVSKKTDWQSVTKPTHFHPLTTTYSYSVNLSDHFDYHIAFLCCHVKSGSHWKRHSWSDDLILWPTPGLLSGDSPYSHLIWITTRSCSLSHSKPYLAFGHPREVSVSFSHSTTYSLLPYMIIAQTLCHPVRRQSQFRHAHLVDALLSSLHSLWLVIITRHVLIIVSLFGTHLWLYILHWGGAWILTLCLHPKSSVQLKAYSLLIYLLLLLALLLLTLPLPFATGVVTWSSLWSISAKCRMAGLR